MWVSLFLFLAVNRKEKVEALFVLDMLEGTGLQVLSRRNIQCMRLATMRTTLNLVLLELLS